jgi:hypothetical protein
MQPRLDWSAAQLPGVLFKRLIWSNWFAPIVRVGSTGFEKHLPKFEPDPANGSRWVVLV